VQDVFSRRIIGWSMRDDLKSELVLDALGMAVTVRGGDAAGVVAHSDHGSQDTSLVYGAYAKQSGIDLSMGSIGDPWDNAVAESFFACPDYGAFAQAGDGARTHDPQLGKLMLYQLSYARVGRSV
jgi:transposase InsO family protein